MNKISMLYAAILLACLLNVVTKGESPSRYENHPARSADVHALNSRASNNFVYP